MKLGGALDLGEVGEHELARVLESGLEGLEGQLLGRLVLRDNAPPLVGLVAGQVFLQLKGVGLQGARWAVQGCAGADQQLWQLSSGLEAAC